MAYSIQQLTMQKAAPGLREMRQQLSRASGAGYANPNVKRMALREALAGYGEGVGSLMSAATSAATSEYNDTMDRQSRIPQWNLADSVADDRANAMTLALARQKQSLADRREREEKLSQADTLNYSRARSEQERQDAINAEARNRSRTLEDLRYSKGEQFANEAKRSLEDARQYNLAQQSRQNQLTDQATQRRQYLEDQNRQRNLAQEDAYAAQENAYMQQNRQQNLNLLWQDYLRRRV